MPEPANLQDPSSSNFDNKRHPEDPLVRRLTVECIQLMGHLEQKKNKRQTKDVDFGEFRGYPPGN